MDLYGVLTILSFVIAVFAWFGITPQKLSSQAITTESTIKNLKPRAKIVVSICLLVSAFWLFFAQIMFQTKYVGSGLACLSMIFSVWGIALHIGFWHSSIKLEKLGYNLINFVATPLIVASAIVPDPIMDWQRTAIKLAVIAAVFTIRILLRMKLRSKYKTK